jgi:hypothetical protein
MTDQFWTWFFTYPPGVGFAPWEIVWYVATYIGGFAVLIWIEGRKS